MDFNILRVVILTIVFIFVFPGKNFIKVEPFLIWKIDKQNIDNYKCDKFYIPYIGNLKKLFFREKNRVIFFKNRGKIVKNYKLSREYYVSGGTGERGVICYLKDGDRIYFLDRSKGVIWQYKSFAYPFLSLNNNWILLVTGENGGYSVIDYEANKLSDFVSSGALMLSFSMAYFTNLIVMGYANGMVSLYDVELNLLWNKDFDKSEISIIKKVSISPNGEYIAVLSGLNPEHLYILNSKGEIISDYITGEERRRAIDLIFSQDSQFLLEESKTGFRVYSLKKRKLLLEKKLFEETYERKIISMDISYNGDFIIIAYRDSNEVSLIELYSLKGVMLFRLLFENKNPLVLFSFNKNSFLIETENKIFVYGF